MPLYEYRCEQCAKVFEVLQKFSDLPVKTCEVCGSSVEKLISRTSFQLKGTGWYATDYKKAPPAAAASPLPAANKGTGDAKTESKSETKGEAKTEVKVPGSGAATGTAKKADSTLN